MADAPAIKPWYKEGKYKLQNLIDQNKVDITNTNDTNYIDSICHKYFREQKIDNFRHNFRSFAPSIDIEEHFAGYRARHAAGGIVFYCNYFYFILCYLTSAILLLLKIAEEPPSDTGTTDNNKVPDNAAAAANENEENQDPAQLFWASLSVCGTQGANNCFHHDMF